MDQNQKPKIPEGYRELAVREAIQAGDLTWEPFKKQWIEIADSTISVTKLREGWYCRKID